MEIDYNNYMFAKNYVQVDLHGGLDVHLTVTFLIKDVIESVNSGTSAMYKNKNLS